MMKRSMKVSLVSTSILLAVAILVPGPTRAVAQGGPGPMPPQSHAYGKTLTEWLKLGAIWAYGGDQGDSVGNVRFLPVLIPVTDDPRLVEINGFPYYVDQFEVMVRPGTAFVVPVYGIVAETYNPDGGDPADDIHDPFIQDLLRQTFAELTALVELDGRRILDSEAVDLLRYASDLYEFDEPLFYDEPKVGLVDPGPPPVFLTSYGAIAGQGIGFVLPPLPPGDHVLKVFEKDEFLFDYGVIVTYQIRVRR